MPERVTRTVRRRLFRERDASWASGLAMAYAVCGYVGGFALMARAAWPLAAFGVLLTAHALWIAAYLIHEACHEAIFLQRGHNRVAGEVMSFIAGGSYASFERMRHLHLRHHGERADVTCFDYRSFLLRRPAWVRSFVLALEWAYVPAVEVLMHAQVIVRPFVEPSQRRYLPRVLVMLLVRLSALGVVAWFFPRAVLLYFVAYGLFLTGLVFMDAFHHTYEQYFVAADQSIDKPRPDRAYEQAHTYSNVLSLEPSWLNVLTLNFGFHNAHHERASAPWYRLPRLHRELFPESAQILPASALLRTFHKNRLRRVLGEDYGAVGAGPSRADSFVGAHGVSFLTVV